jgi:hypothetical protein
MKIQLNVEVDSVAIPEIALSAAPLSSEISLVDEPPSQVEIAKEEDRTLLDEEQSEKIIEISQSAREKQQSPSEIEPEIEVDLEEVEEKLVEERICQATPLIPTTSHSKANTLCSHLLIILAILLLCLLITVKYRNRNDDHINHINDSCEKHTVEMDLPPPSAPAITKITLTEMQPPDLSVLNSTGSLLSDSVASAINLNSTKIHMQTLSKFRFQLQRISQKLQLLVFFLIEHFNKWKSAFINIFTPQFLFMKNFGS